MLYQTDLPLSEDGGLDVLYCATCGQHVWTRGLFCVFEPCPHTLLFTDCELEQDAFCEPGLRAHARALFPEEFVGVRPTDTASGPLYFDASELLDQLPRPDDPALFVVRIEGEAGDGLLLATAPLEPAEAG